MTENEAIKAIEHDLEWHSKELQPKYKEVLRFTIQALEEIQQYRAIGTVEELRAIKSDGFTDHLLNMGYTKGYRNGIDEFAEALKEICKNHPISNDGHTPLYIHEDGTYHELIEDAVKRMKGGGNND